MTTIEKPKFFTVEEVAETLKMSTKTVRRRIADGSLKAGRIGRLLRISEEDLVEYMKQSDPTPPKNPKIRKIKKLNSKKG